MSSAGRRADGFAATSSRRRPSTCSPDRCSPACSPAATPDHAGLRVVEGIPIHAELEFAAAGAGTVLRFRAYGQPAGALRLMSPLLGRTLRRQFTADCARLKLLLEG